jgi:hypothetical protein
LLRRLASRRTGSASASRPCCRACCSPAREDPQRALVEHRRERRLEQGLAVFPSLPQCGRPARRASWRNAALPTLVGVKFTNGAPLCEAASGIEGGAGRSAWSASSAWSRSSSAPSSAGLARQASVVARQTTITRSSACARRNSARSAARCRDLLALGGGAAGARTPGRAPARPTSGPSRRPGRCAPRRAPRRPPPRPRGPAAGAVPHEVGRGRARAHHVVPPR